MNLNKTAFWGLKSHTLFFKIPYTNIFLHINFQFKSSFMFLKLKNQITKWIIHLKIAVGLIF